jgi:hypothetical protein
MMDVLHRDSDVQVSRSLQLLVFDGTVLQLQQLRFPATQCRHKCCSFAQQLDL